MSQNLILKNKGLFTNSNQLSAVPIGALSIAKNVVIDKDDVVEPCRGFLRLLYPDTDTDTRNDRGTVYQDHILVRRSNDDSMAYYVEGAGYTEYSGTYAHPDSDYARMQFMQAKGNLYFTTSSGVKVLDNYAGPVYSTGMPRGLDGSGATTGGSGFMTTDRQVAYRVVWGSRDANNNLYLGTASQRWIVANTSGGTRDVANAFSIPTGITVNDFYQVYRSKESASATDEPNDELQLVYEKNPTAGQIIAKSVTFTDSTPTSLMGDSLYSNASVEGIAESNDEPPFAKDICEFKDYTFYLNVKSKHRLTIKLLAVGGTGIAANDTITIDGVVFTGKASETIASGQFKVTTGGSAAQNIADTAISLVKVINQYASNTTIYAHYLSGYQDLPGQILLMKRVLSDTSFTVTQSNSGAFDLDTATSSGDVFQNGIMWSKNGQPEHVPTGHLAFIGSKNFEARRCLALTDSIFILKDDGVFRLTGSGGSWTIEPFDTSTRIIAPDSAKVVNNQIFALCDQGLVTISGVGVQVISRPIEDEIGELTSDDFTKLKKYTFGVEYDTDRKYYLWTIGAGSDASPTKAFIYNTFTNAYTTREKSAKFAFVNKTDNKMYVANPDDRYLLQERKSLTAADLVDEEIDGIVVISSSGKSVVLNTVVGLQEGDLLYSSSSVYSMITDVDQATNTVLVNDVKTWPAGAISAYKGIESEVEYAVQHFENPGVMKHFQECKLLMRKTSFINATLSFFTDISGGYSESTVNGTYGNNFWGLGLWGAGNWGAIFRPKPIRCDIPREKSRGTLLSVKFKIRNAYAAWALNGISLNYEWVSERTSGPNG